MRVAVVGAGAVGARVARQLAATEAIDAIFVVTDSRPALVEGLGPRSYLAHDLVGLDLDVVVLAKGAGNEADVARRQLESGRHVVSTADAPDTIAALLDLDALARAHRCACVVGAGFAPGLSGLLARHLAREFEHVDEVHVAKSGTGGPTCAREHHRALSAAAVEFVDGVRQERRGGSGRELCWFPNPVGARDCYRADLADPVLLHRSLPDARRITARVAATRRDRFLGGLPMMRAPHIEGVDGAVRVEVRGRRGSTRVTAVAGSAGPPAVAAGAVAAAAALLAPLVGAVGAMSCHELGADDDLLAAVVARGVRVSRFVGQPV